ncbi:hypothetical protein AG4045_008753 [Apium graveolens]|uniref:Uncharacterized protein n=1 Tax=Apium graveolens TaxID=4045 RepID=A0A6L5BAP8_APIGR|nr:hypothetical protein AG4045_008753 [Apium graveolens]
MSHMSQLTGKLEAVSNECKKLEDMLKSLKNEEGAVSDLVLKKLEGTLQVLLDVKESMEAVSVTPNFSMTDIKDLMDMLYISKDMENIQYNTQKKNQWRNTCSSISNKNIKLIQSAAPLFLGREDGITTYQDLSTSYVQHAQKFLHNSNEKIGNCDITYSGYRDLLKAIESSPVFKLSPEKKKVELVSEVSLNIHDEDVGVPTIIVKTKPISIKKEMFIIYVSCADGKVYKYSFGECFDNKFLSYKPYEQTLEEYLDSTPLSKRRESLFKSKLLYPNKYAKGLIQGLLSAVVERITSKKPHDYLIHPQNILLHEQIYPPYPPSYFSCPKLSNADDKIVKNAYEKRQYVIPVSFVHSTCNEKMGDLDAVYKLIFEKILEDKDDKPSLPQDWQLLKNDLGKGVMKTYEATSDLIYHEKMSSSIVLRDWQDQLNLLMYAYHLYFYSTSEMKSAVQGALNQIDIIQFKLDWCKVVQQVDRTWYDVFYHEGSTFYKGNVGDLLRYFRNLVTHGEKTKSQAYLAYQISCEFPEMLPQISQRLLEIGIKF